MAATGDVGIQIAKRAWASLHGLLFGTNFFAMSCLHHFFSFLVLTRVTEGFLSVHLDIIHIA